ncbi:phosphatase PAP2 family protein [Kaistia dalseonensis]|uniref:Membrane-associated phospholipid phosphatase n=1 Tax=Kaistia dalseonensis TaxID=410840 RepID=A0ABU0HC09_9HYPH|nr:phosphatase PAP2 family protein [Kaistia dalseonensis]MCX5497217.1 phosphatase PAP2 family protein [Kaistia dalseonensis]MDQ0439848.1 membrane-associated phospholipid phosphatase [Kaistia dalseonensis]
MPHLNIGFYGIITGFGGQGVILPVVLLVAVTLLLAGQRRAALWWTLSIVTVLALMLIAKLGFIPCGRYWPQLRLRSPSGHAASAVAVFGGLAVIFARLAAGRMQQIAILGAGFVLALMIAFSRIALGAHTPSEVLFGCVIGLGAPLVLWSRKDLLQRPLRLRWIWLIVGPIVLLLLLRNADLGAEERIDAIAYWIVANTGICR